MQDVLLKFHVKLTAKPIDPARYVRYLWKEAVNSAVNSLKSGRVCTRKAAFDYCCKDDGIVPKSTDLWADAFLGWRKLWQPLSR